MSGVITPAVVAAIVSATILLIGHWISGRRERLTRRRELFAKALAATIDYRELAYAVRRRRSDEAAAERVRLSEAMRAVQQDLAFHEAWIRLESSPVAAAFGDLVRETRRTAGGYIRAAWETPPITSDAEMNVPGGLDFNGLKAFEVTYVEAVRRHLAAWSWVRERLAAWKLPSRSSQPAADLLDKRASIPFDAPDGTIGKR